VTSETLAQLRRAGIEGMNEELDTEEHAPLEVRP
jgi:hypothetical protein